MAAPQTPDDAARQRATAPPWPVIALALLAGVVMVPATTFGGYLLATGQQAIAARLTTTNDAPAPAPTPQVVAPAGGGDWQALLRGQACEPPCIGGIACLSRPLACTSGLTCIPGAGEDRFGDDEVWTLHLSAVREGAPDGTVIDPCTTRKNFWVCRSGTAICVSQSDACNHAANSEASIPVTGAELAHQGLSLEVRLGSAAGPLLAKTETIVDLRRGGLCRGFSARAVGGDVRRLTYFVLPP
jgi:hypothetical protein